MTMMDSLEIIASCDLVFAQPCLFRVCMLSSYKSPRYHVSVYRTIDPLVTINAHGDNLYKLSFTLVKEASHQMNLALIGQAVLEENMFENG